jgi:hypothetical protein
MKTDIYTKVVLTAIAVGLFLNIGISSIPNANAEIYDGSTLYVHLSGSIGCDYGCK